MAWLLGVVWEFLTTGWDASRVVHVGLAIAGTSFGAIMAWRNAEERVLERLRGYLLREERRVEQARAALLDRFRRPHLGKAADIKIFSNRELDSAFRRLRKEPRLFKRKFWTRAQRELVHVADITKEKAQLARSLERVHQKQNAAAHLLLGAMADARSDHATAWDHFEAALKIDNNDTEALEYAGIQLLKLGNAERALEYFTRLLVLAVTSSDKMLTVRTLRNQANAYERQPRPQLNQARDALRKATAALPENADPVEAAATFEFLGNVRRRLNVRKRARDSFTEALRRYATQKTPEAHEGVERMNTAIEEINRELEGITADEEVEPTSPDVPNERSV
jgi:tetratricopeptide (TPR) repeat protein